MNPKLKERINIIYLTIFLTIVCLVLVMYNGQAYVAIDTTIYTIIGKDIFESLTLPYGNTFDHKPLFTYYIYGFFHYLVGQKYLYLSIAFACTLSSSIILSNGNPNKFLVISSFILVSSVVIDNFSGNSEMLMLPFIGLYIYFYTSRINNKYKFFLIGAMAALVFNINYLAAPIMMPVTLYMFFSKGFDSYISRILRFSFGFILINIIIFSPFYITHQGIAEYFTLQFQFLTSYSGSSSRLMSLIYLSKFIAVFLPIVILYILRTNRDEYFYVTCLLYIGTIIGAFMSDRGYAHYLEPMVIPLSIMFWTVLNQERKKITIAIVSPLAAATIYFLPSNIASLKEINYINTAEAQNDLNHLNKLARVDKSSLNIQSTHIIYLYSDLKNVNKYIWPNHPQIMFGKYVNHYYINEIKKEPHVIMTKVGMCSQPNDVCASMKNSYIFDSRSKIHGGYDLYTRR